MNYRIVQVQPGRPEGGSVCKVILQSSEWFIDTLTHQRHDIQGSISGMAAERGEKKYLPWQEVRRSTAKRPSVCRHSLGRAGLACLGANSTNGLFYDRAAQIKRVSMQCVCDKRRLEMLAVRPLISRSYILNRSVCLKTGRLHSSQRKLKVENRRLDEPKKPTPFPTAARPEWTPKSDAPISKSTHLVMQRAGNTGASTGKGEPF